MPKHNFTNIYPKHLTLINSFQKTRKNTVVRAVTD